MQVLFALICNPEWTDLPYREIAQRANVAHGTVGWVMAELPKLGLVVELGGKRWCGAVIGEKAFSWPDAKVSIGRSARRGAVDHSGEGEVLGGHLKAVTATPPRAARS